MQAGARATSSRRELGSRSVSQPSCRPFLLVCLFVAGAVAGLGGGYVAGTKRIVDGTIEQARGPIFPCRRRRLAKHPDWRQA
jgi:hypothetical protein